MPQVNVLPQNEAVSINNIFLVGRNYAQDPGERDKRAAAGPIVTLKPTSAVIFSGEKIRLPACSKRVIYEAELLILIGRAGKNVAEADALSYALAYGVGIDVIAHDLHEQAKAQGLPWTVSKGFDTFAPLSPFIDAGEVPDPQRVKFSLDVNGERRQNGDAAQMIFSIARIISYLSSVFTLHRGDVIYTGTPPGSGPLKSGDRLTLDYSGLISAQFDVA